MSQWIEQLDKNMHLYDIEVVWMNLCNYSDIFGRPKQGAHSYRFLGVAIVDVVGTIIGGIAIGKALNISVLTTVIILFIIGIVLHYTFCVDTTINTILFGKWRT